MGIPQGAAVRDHATRGLTVFWIIFATLIAVFTAMTPRDAQAQATCAFGFSVPYASPEYSYVMSETENRDVLLACDTLYPAPDSGLFPQPQTGTTSGGGAFEALENVTDNTIKYTPSPTFSGTDTFTVTFCNASGCPQANLRVATVTVTVGAPTLSMAPAAGALTGGAVGIAYSGVTFTASGSASPFTFSVPIGALPPGLSLGTVSSPTGTSSTVQLSGTPTAGGTFNFTLRATDSSTGSGPFDIDQAYSIIITPPSIAINTASVANGTQGASYSQTLTASGGTAPRSFTVSDGALPLGLTLSTAGVLSGTPTEAGEFTFTARAEDSSTGTGPYSGTRQYTFTIAAIAAVANPISATVSYGSTNNPITLNITGGAPQTVAIGTQAGNGTATATGTSITYTPNSGYGGPDSFTYTATNTAGTSTPATVTITVSPPTITIGPASLAGGTTGNAYSQTVSASGGSGSYTYSVSVGSLPAGLDIDDATGEISGTPTGPAGPVNFTIRAADTSTGTGPYEGTKPYTITIAVPNPPIANPVSATVAYGSTSNPITLNITGGAPTSVAVGTQATNGTATAAGTSITYTPNSGYSGPDSFTYTATNPDGTSSAATVTITVNPQPPVANAASATVAFNSTNNPVTLSLTGGTATSVAVATQASNGTATASGTTISYTPNAGYFGSDSFTYTATNPGGTSAPAIVSITVDPAAPVANDVGATVAANSTNNAITLNITGGPPTSVAVATGPSHGSTSIAGTTISYTPTAGYSGTDSFTYTATNVTDTSAPATVSITVTPATLSLSAIAATGVATTSYSQTITATLGTTPYEFEVTSGALPDGLDLDPGTGAITGTPDVVDTFNFSVTATDVYGATGSQAYTIVISAPTITISPAAGALPAATTGTAYSQSFTATGGNGTHTFAFAPGSSAPPGLTLTSAGVLSGTPNSAGSYSFTIVPSDTTATGDGPFAGTPAAFSLEVTDPAVTISSPAAGALPATTTGGAYRQSFTASGGNGAHTFALAAGSSAPPGLTLSTAGVLSGTPNSAGSYSFDIIASDGTPAGDGGPFKSAAVTYSLAVSDPTVTITSPSPGGTLDAYSSEASSTTFTATGGQGPHKFTLTGTLPDGLTFTEAGVLSGTIQETGSFNFSVTATDSTPAGDGGPFSSSAASYALSATDDTAPAFDTFPDDIIVEIDPPGTSSVVSWTEPTASDNISGVTITQTTGLASGATFPLGPTVITYKASDVAGNEVTENFTVTVVQRAQGRVTVVINTTVDGTFNFSSPEAPLNFAVATSSGSGSSGAINVNPGTFPVSFSVPQGFDVATASCSDGVSAIDPKAHSGSITVVSGANVTCTLSASDIGKTTGLIGQFLEARSQLILANGPDSSRRIERLTGHYSSQGGVAGFGLSFGNEVLPFGLRFTERDASFSYSLRRAMAKDGPNEQKLAGFDGLYADGGNADAPPNPFDIWVEGKLARFDAEGGDGDFGILHAGADYLVTPGVLLGLGGQLDWTDMDGEDDAEIDGFGYMIGPYLTARLSESFFFDARAAWGQSYNNVSPFGTYTDEVDATRWLISAALIGRFDIDRLTIQPKAEVAYYEEKSEDYEDSLGFGIPSVKSATGTFTFGPRVSTRMELSESVGIEPFLSLEGIWTFSQENTATTVSESPGLEETGLRGRSELGFTLFGEGALSLSASGFYDGIGSSDFEAWGGNFRFSQEF